MIKQESVSYWYLSSLAAIIRLYRDYQI